MKCNQCNNEIPSDSKFCPFCGNRVTSKESAPAPAPAPVEPVAEPVTPPVNVESENTSTPPAAPATENKSSILDLLPFSLPSFVTLPVLAIAAVAAVAVVAILLVILFSGGTSPQDAAQNLIDNGNFTVVAKASGEKVTIQVDLDFKEKDATIYAENSDGFLFAIYDGYYIEQSYNYWYGEYYLTATDVSEQIATFFDSYESADNSDWDEVASMLEEMMGVDIEDYVNIKKFDKAMDTLEKKLETKSWLKKNAGYSTEREDGVKLHIYEPNVFEFANAVLDIFENCFEDEDLYEDLVDSLDDVESDLEDMEVAFTMGVKGKYLVKAEVEYEGVKVRLSFNKIGSTEIDIDELEALLDEASLF